MGACIFPFLYDFHLYLGLWVGLSKYCRGRELLTTDLVEDNTVQDEVAGKQGSCKCCEVALKVITAFELFR